MLAALIISACFVAFFGLIAIAVFKALSNLCDKIRVQTKSIMMAMIDQVVAKGTSYAEQESKKHLILSNAKMACDRKMELAIAYISQEIVDYGLPPLSADDLIVRIESYLGLGTLNQGFEGGTNEANVFDD